jgi:hypothetical protein
VAVKKIFLSRDSENGEVSEIPVPKMPEDILYPLQAYLGELPGYDSTVPYNKQSGDMPSQQHGFALMYFTGIFQQLSTSLGHIFKVETSDIDMRDVVLNRRQSSGAGKLGCDLGVAGTDCCCKSAGDDGANARRTPRRQRGRNLLAQTRIRRLAVPYRV